MSCLPSKALPRAPIKPPLPPPIIGTAHSQAAPFFSAPSWVTSHRTALSQEKAKSAFKIFVKYLCPTLETKEKCLKQTGITKSSPAIGQCACHRRAVTQGLEAEAQPCLSNDAFVAALGSEIQAWAPAGLRSPSELKHEDWKSDSRCNALHTLFPAENPPVALVWVPAPLIRDWKNPWVWDTEEPFQHQAVCLLL